MGLLESFKDEAEEPGVSNFSPLNFIWKTISASYLFVGLDDS